MAKKKRFGISEALTRGLSETIHVVEHNQGLYRNVIIPLSRIELDPDNPRKLAIDLKDVRMGIRADDPLYQQKQDELERLKELAHTIKTSGIINPIVGYKLADFYRVVAGERRCLASILAGKQEIEARVFNEKPKGFDLKLIQWIENTAREDLSLNERLGNIKEIITEYHTLNPSTTMTATVLKNITGLSLSQTTYYLMVLRASEDIQYGISQGHIRSLDKAAFLSGIDNIELRVQAVLACKDGASLKVLRQLVAENKPLVKTKIKPPQNHIGRKRIKIDMGSTLKPTV